MKLYRTKKFEADFHTLPEQIKIRLQKQLALLIQDWRYPSLQVKKMKGWRDIFEARITDGYRFTFQISNDGILLRRTGPHDVLKNP